jgi:hypothetical protein
MRRMWMQLTTNCTQKGRWWGTCVAHTWTYKVWKESSTLAMCVTPLCDVPELAFICIPLLLIDCVALLFCATCGYVEPIIVVKICTQLNHTPIWLCIDHCVFMCSIRFRSLNHLRSSFCRARNVSNSTCCLQFMNMIIIMESVSCLHYRCNNFWYSGWSTYSSSLESCRTI